MDRLRVMFQCGRRTVLVAGLLASVGWTLAAPAGATARRSSRHGAPVVITVLSVRSDLVSGGEALVAIRLPPRAQRYRFRFTAAVGRRNVTDIFVAVSRWRREGLLTGLSVGRNVLSVRLPDGSGARLVITNHPSGGPVFSGPQLQPWTCEPGAMDRQCDKPPTYTYYYKSSDPLNSGLSAVRPVASGGRCRNDHDPDRRHRPVHRPRRDRLHRPRPIRDLGPLSAGQAMERDRAAAAVRAQAADHARRQL